MPYNPLHDQGYPSIGCRTCTSPVTHGEADRAGRWRGNEKTECGLHVVRAPVPHDGLSRGRSPRDARMSDADRRPAAAAPPALFPAFLRLTGKRVVVVGGGPVAASKLTALLDAGRDVTVVAPVVARDIEARRSTIHRRPFEVAISTTRGTSSRRRRRRSTARWPPPPRAAPVRQRRRRSGERVGVSRRRRAARRRARSRSRPTAARRRSRACCAKGSTRCCPTTSTPGCASPTRAARWKARRRADGRAAAELLLAINGLYAAARTRGASVEPGQRGKGDRGRPEPRAELRRPGTA